MTESLEAIFTAVDRAPTSAAYADASRRLRPLRQSWRPVRLALVSSFTIDLLVPYVDVETARLGLAAEVYIAPFGTVQQELLRPGTGCVAHHPDIVFVSQLLADACPPLVDDFLGLSPDEVEELVEGVLSDIASALHAFRQRSDAALVVCNFALPPHAVLGLYEVAAGNSQTEVIRRMNRRLVDVVSAVHGAYVLDFERALATVGYRSAHDERLWHIARAPLAPSMMRELARRQAAFVQALVGAPRKCLVVDLDNTLWGGIVGEAGADAVALGQTYPGSAYRQFQLAIRQLAHRGVLLAINSKNNPDDAREVLDGHPGMILRTSDFAAMRMNWQDKPSNMLEIAEELNLGTDSLVFVDDSPVERATMRQALPEVLTIEMPAHPIEFRQALLDCCAFERVTMTSEDRRRGRLYHEQRQRTHLAGSVRSVEEFLRTLEMDVAIAPIDERSFPRALDLLHKTNQFNLTTRRYGAAVLRDMMADATCGTFVLHAADRFGDNGIVGIAIVKTGGQEAVIDSLALSCRVIGRTLETAFLSFLADWARRRGIDRLEGEFVSTAKNAPAADFYQRHGFQRVSEAAGTVRWSMSLREASVEWPSYIRMASEPAVVSGANV